jgi:hypothetical protein
MRRILIPVFLLLIAPVVFAGTITSLDPSSIQVNSGEYFMTAYGTSLGNTLVFDGPAGHFEREVSATFSNRVVGWIPEAIVAKSGTHSLKVRAANGVETNSVNFTVVGFKFFPLALLVPDVMIVQPKTREGVTVKFDIFPVGGEDPNPQAKCDYESGAFFKMGQTVVSCTAWNSFGERADAKFTINVADRVGPVVTVPGEIRVSARSNEGAVVEFSAKANDEIWGDMPTDCAPKSGSMFRIGRTAVVCTSVDLDLNVGVGSFVVEVVGPNGTPKPLTLTLPQGLQVEARDPDGAKVEYVVKVEGTKDPNPIINCTPKSGSQFPVGDTTVTCDALDSEGAWGEGSFGVRVVDLKAPDIRYAKPSADKIPPDGRMWPVSIEVEATDDIDLRPTCSIIGVTANEDIDAGDGEEKPEYDYAITDTLKVELRGETTRAMRVYNVWVGCSDFFGNMAQTYAQVAVSKDAGSNAITGTRRRAGGKP